MFINQIKAIRIFVTDHKILQYTLLIESAAFNITLSRRSEKVVFDQTFDILIKQWMEKKPNGVFIFRNDRAEDREARIHSNSKHKTMELLISKIQAQIEKEMAGRISLFCFTFISHI